MKKLGLSLMAVAVVMLVAATSNAALISLYSFDDGGGTTAANSVSGKAAGTMSGTAAFGAGYIGTGAYVGSVGSYLDIGSASLFEWDAFGTNANGFWTGTYSAWIKSTNTTPMEMFGMGFANTVGGYRAGEIQAAVMWEGTKFPSGSYAFRKTGGTSLGTATGQLRDGDWHLLTVTYTLTTGTSPTGGVTWFLDGAQKGTVTGGSSNSTTSASTWGATSAKRIFADPSLAAPLIGMGDDFANWNNRLGAEQVEALYNLGKDLDFKYGAADAQALFDLYAGPVGGTASVRGKTWQKVDSGLGTSDGVIYREGAVTGLNLGGSTGAGVVVVPEPGTLSLLLAGAIGLLVFAWRKRK